ncbi:MAG: DeoR/GlpR transcriptional regulator [Opitutaceae bacterium]|jgi:DeoR/GlpR family transcriptional regulator of sugar metabolism|nr:DeoR/GlpR transcriptional regulator [Opitutaceae bacterium]
MTTDRHQQILALLRDQPVISARDLRVTLGVTAMTVWRDLRELEELGLLRRVRGGARALPGRPGEPEFETKATAAGEAKRRIAACAAARFIRAGETVALEGGTTVAALVDHLPLTRVSVLTNSLPVALRVRDRRPNLPVKLPGGWLSQVSGNMVGPEALQFIAQQRASSCFLSATGFDATHGPTDPNPLEIEIKRAWAAVSGRVVLLLDASKFGSRSAAVMIHPRRLHAIVTDAPPPPPIAECLTRHGVEVVVASPPPPLH